MLGKGQRDSARTADGEDRRVTALSRNYRRAAAILGFGLIVLTVFSCLPYAPQGPFDARDHSRLKGMKLETHPWEAIIEPLAAPYMILGGAPDFRTAAVSVIVWVLLGAAALGMLAEFRAQKLKRPFAIVYKGILTALVAFLTLVLIIFFFVIARIPCWRLVVDNPDMIVADFHSHTTKSPDALVSLQTNLEWHASCGYDMEALTDHDQLFDHKISGLPDSAVDRLPAFVSGIEAHTGHGAVLLGICRNPPILFKVKHQEAVDRTPWFVKKIHQGCGGAVISVTLKGRSPRLVSRLADEGVDGFEIANSGHPDIPPQLRRAVLDVARSHGLVLVADTDWHGWTGLAKTWNVIKAPGASALSRSQRANLVLSKLREHDSADIIPVVAGYIGEPSRARAIFSPFVETLRYAMELSPARVISWWVWVWAVFILWAYLQGLGLRAGGILLSVLNGATGLGLIFAGMALIGQAQGGSAPYPIHIGLATIAVGTAALGISAYRAAGLLTERKRHGV